MRKWRRYKGFISKLEALGYNVQEEVLDAKDFGVAQTRRRLFILCDRENIPSKVRAIKNGRPKPVKQILDNDGRWKARPLLTDERAENTIVRYLTGLERVGESKPFLLVYYGSDGSGGWQRLERPLRTITTVNRFALVKHERGEPKIRMLQVPELQRAMGFGTDFKLNGGSRRERIRLLGNAVCPPVVTAVIRALTRNGNASPNSKRPTGSDHRTRPR
jgi:DNA (cytosine-5)-methyltransferase 1